MAKNNGASEKDRPQRLGLDWLQPLTDTVPNAPRERKHVRANCDSLKAFCIFAVESIKAIN